MNRPSFFLVCLALLTLAVATPASAAEIAAQDATSAEPGIAPNATPAGAAVEPVLDFALEQSFTSQYGDCRLFCDGQQYTYSYVTREECCSGSLTCPNGLPAATYAFYPYQGFAVLCSV